MSLSTEGGLPGDLARLWSDRRNLYRCCAARPQLLKLPEAPLVYAELVHGRVEGGER